MPPPEEKKKPLTPAEEQVRLRSAQKALFPDTFEDAPQEPRNPLVGRDPLMPPAEQQLQFSPKPRFDMTEEQMIRGARRLLLGKLPGDDALGQIPEGQQGKARFEVGEARKQINDSYLDQLVATIGTQRERSGTSEREPIFQKIIRNLMRVPTVAEGAFVGMTNPSKSARRRGFQSMRRAADITGMMLDEPLFADAPFRMEDFVNPEHIVDAVAPGMDSGPVKMALGTTAMMFADPLRFVRIGSLTPAGIAAAHAQQLAKAPITQPGMIRKFGRLITPGRRAPLDAPAIGSELGAQARAGQRAMLQLRIPFTKRQVAAFRGAPLLSAFDNVRLVGAKSLGVGMAPFGGRYDFKRAFEDAAMSGNIKEMRKAAEFTEMDDAIFRVMETRGWDYDEAAQFLVGGSERLVTKADRAPFARLKTAQADQLRGKATRLRTVAERRSQKLIDKADEFDRQRKVMNRDMNRRVRDLEMQADEFAAGRKPLELKEEGRPAIPGGIAPDPAKAARLRKQAKALSKKQEAQQVALTNKATSARRNAQKGINKDLVPAVKEEAKIAALERESKELMAAAPSLREVAPQLRKDIMERMGEQIRASIDPKTGKATMSRVDAFRSARASILFDIDPVLAPAVVEFQKLFRGVIADELQMGLAIQHLSDPAVHYVTRAMTDEFREFLIENGRMRGFMDNFNSWYKKQTSTIKRKSVFEGMTIPEINGWAITHGKGFKGTMFEVSPALIGANRAKNLGRAARTSDFLHDVFRDFGRAADEVVDNPGWVSADDIMARHGVQPRREAFRGGELVPTKLASAEGKMIPAEIGDALDGVLKKWRDPQTSSVIMRTLDESTKAWRTMVTAPFPAFHFRNHVSNVWANHLGDVDMIGSYSFGRKIVRDLGKGGNAVWDLGNGVKKTSNQIKSEMQAGGAWGFGAFGKSEQRSGLARLPVIKQGLAAGEFIENYDKLVHYVDRIRKGFTPETAARSVKQYLFNYADLPPVEKAIFRRLVPFWTWQRKNLPLQLQMLFQKPGKFSQLGHIQNAMIARDENGAMVDTSVVMPWERRRLFGVTSAGNVFGGIGIGSEDLAVLDIARFGDYGEFLSMMNPIIKAASQEVAQEDFFRGIPLNQSDIAPASLSVFEAIPVIGPMFLKAIDFRERRDAQGNVIGFRANPRMMNALNMIPGIASGSRIASEASRLVNPNPDELRPEFGDGPVAKIGEHFLSPRFLTGFRHRSGRMEQAMFNTVARFTDDLTRALEVRVREGTAFESHGRFGLRRDAIMAKDPRIVDLLKDKKLLAAFKKIEAQLRRADFAARRRKGIRSQGAR